MNIKRWLLFLTIIPLSLGLLSCNSISHALGVKSDKEIVNARFQNIIDTLENKDKERLKKMFSPNALKEADDIDVEIDYIMDFFNGKTISMEGGPSVESSSKHDGVRAVQNKYDYTVETDKGRYIVFFIYISEDTFNPENVGLYMLQIINEKDKEIEYDRGQAIRCPGIYCPPVTKYTNLKLEPGTEIAGGFKLLKYKVDNNDDKFNISAIIKSDIAYCNASIVFCFYDANGKKIGVASGGTVNLKANGTFEIKEHATDYEGNDLNYKDIASYKFFGIDAF